MMNKSEVSESQMQGNPHNYYLPHLDTTITLDPSVILFSDSSVKAPLTLSKAKRLLYAFFKTKDFYVGGDIPENYPETNLYNSKGEYKLDVEFDTMVYVNLNNDKLADAIVFFTQTPPYGSGHCLGYSSKAIIMSNGANYSFMGLDFIPLFFIINKINQSAQDAVVLEGDDYDCAEWTIKRSFKATLKFSK
jgi:hypothetical protein